MTCSPIAHWNDPVTMEPDNGFASGILIRLGYGFSNTNSLLWGIDISYRHAALRKDTIIAQAIDGVFWQHYFNGKLRNMYSSVGIGYLWFFMDNRSLGHHGYCVQFGTGWEVVKHLDISLLYTLGRSSYGEKKIWHDILSIGGSAKLY